MRVIAIDPGFDRCGVAVLERAAESDRLVHSSCIRTSPRLPFANRLRELGLAFEVVINEYAPDEFALETLYFGNNTKTALAVAEARGVICFVAAQHNLAISEYTPGAVKIAVTGVGNADKHQITHMVPRLVRLVHTPTYDDEYDAIAIGLTHLASRNVLRR